MQLDEHQILVGDNKDIVKHQLLVASNNHGDCHDGYKIYGLLSCICQQLIIPGVVKMDYWLVFK